MNGQIAAMRLRQQRAEGRGIGIDALANVVVHRTASVTLLLQAPGNGPIRYLGAKELWDSAPHQRIADGAPWRGPAFEAQTNPAYKNRCWGRPFMLHIRKPVVAFALASEPVCLLANNNVQGAIAQTGVT